ncbi:TlpA disulfide reductase family protein [Parasegetibacter sp. NRK P23]|uniref:TlpA family protein disulfide reductase n=1 Tax=Parasegetibacter sp. NRK P23 TaxID=2942999 RepID=UPI0020430148|nr:TlpA disulfide reductase family protein [Parasegetibacter sp. NRK P23]MCM5530379.1 TlpA family protein disulfide reductase [Parasegetibacter sp. NRK P23]
MILKRIILLLLVSNTLFAQQSANGKYNFQDFSLIVKVEDQEKLYHEMLKEKPADPAKPNMYSEYRAQLALGWLNKGDFKRYWAYKKMNTSFNVLQFLYLTYALEYLMDADKDIAEVEKVSADLMEDIKQKKLNDGIGRVHTLYELNAAANAKLGNTEKALQLMDKYTTRKWEARDMNYFRDSRSNYLHRYAIVMAAAGKTQAAFDTLSKAFKMADSNPKMVATFRTVYKKLKGSDKGFDVYLKSLQEEAYQKYYKEVEKSYIATPQQTMQGFITGPGTDGKKMTLFTGKQPVKDISLMNLEGKMVSLGDYSGKILVVDFWSTLCTPCVAAFSGFERVVEDYKKEPFQLFVINLFEDEATVKSYVEKRKIPLQVLRDEENKAYDIQGTPTKIVFDPTGNIRFYASGYAGSTDREYYKLKAMVEIVKAKNSDLAKVQGH